MKDKMCARILHTERGYEWVVRFSHDFVVRCHTPALKFRDACDQVDDLLRGMEDTEAAYRQKIAIDHLPTDVDGNTRRAQADLANKCCARQ